MALLSAPARVLVDPAARADVTVPLAARVEAVRVREGASVKAGDPLVDVLMPELVRAAGTYLAAGVRLEAATDRTKRLERLREENLARSSELAEALTAVAEARAARIEAESVLRSAGFDGSAAQRLSRGNGAVSLPSPVDGTVVEIHAIPGARVEATGDPLVRIVSQGRPRIEARLPFPAPAGVGYRFAASDTGGAGTGGLPVELVGRSPSANPNDGTFLAWFEPAADDGGDESGNESGDIERRTELAPGTPGVLSVEPGADAVAVPARAIVVRDGETFVLTRSLEGAPRRTPVRVLASSGAEALVRGERGVIDVGTPVAAEGERLLSTGDVP